MEENEQQLALRFKAFNDTESDLRKRIKQLEAQNQEMSQIVAKDKVKIGEYALKAQLFDKTQDEMQTRLNHLQKTVNLQDSKVNQITSLLTKNEEARRDLENQVNALKYLEGLQAHADTIELQLEQIRQEESAVNEKRKKVDKRESETLMQLNRKMNDLENQVGTLIIENERLDKMNKDLSDICKTTEKAFADRQTQLMQEL